MIIIEYWFYITIHRPWRYVGAVSALEAAAAPLIAAKTMRYGILRESLSRNQRRIRRYWMVLGLFDVHCTD